MLSRGQCWGHSQRRQFLIDQRLGEFIPASEPTGAEEPECRTAHAVVAGFCDCVDDASSGTAKLSRVAGSDYLELFDRFLRNDTREVRLFSNANATKVRLVVIDDVDVHAAVDAFLAGKQNFTRRL